MRYSPLLVIGAICGFALGVAAVAPVVRVASAADAPAQPMPYDVLPPGQAFERRFLLHGFASPTAQSSASRPSGNVYALSPELAVRFAFANDDVRAALLSILAPVQSVEATPIVLDSYSNVAQRPYVVRFAPLPPGQYAVALPARHRYEWLQVASFAAIGERGAAGGWLAAIDLATHRLRRDVAFSGSPGMTLREGWVRTARFGPAGDEPVVTVRGRDGSSLEVPTASIAEETGTLDSGEYPANFERFAVSASEAVAASGDTIRLTARTSTADGAPLAGRHVRFQYRSDVPTASGMLPFGIPLEPRFGEAVSDETGTASFAFAIPSDAAGRDLRFDIAGSRLVSLDVPVGASGVAAIALRESRPSSGTGSGIVGREIVVPGVPFVPLRLTGSVVSYDGERPATPVDLRPDRDGVFAGMIPLGPVERFSTYAIGHGDDVVAAGDVLRIGGGAPDIACQIAATASTRTFRVTGFVEGPALAVVGSADAPQLVPIDLRAGATTFSLAPAPLADDPRLVVFGLGGDTLAPVAFARVRDRVPRAPDLACDTAESP